MAIPNILNQIAGRDDLLQQAAETARAYARGIGERRVGPDQQALHRLKEFDETFPNVALIAKVPKTAIRDIKIDTGSPATGNADGILVIKDKDNLHSGLVLSFNGGSPITAVPANYKSTTLE